MIHYDSIVSDSLGANALLSGFFTDEDLINEVAHQVLAEKWFYEEDIWDKQ